MGKAGRPKGSKDSVKRSYTMSPAAIDQRQKLPQTANKIFENIVTANAGELNEEQKKELIDYKMQIWRNLGTPTYFMSEKIAETEMLMKLKMMQGNEVDYKEVQGYLKLLLDWTKELNKYTQVSADKKIDVVRGLDALDGMTIDVEVKEDEKSEEIKR